MAPKRSTVSAEDEAEALLRDSKRVRAPELVQVIHRVNPTGLELPKKVLERRYSLKSRLQSLLLRRFGDDVIVSRVANEAGVVGLHYRPQDRDACHAVVAELEDDVRSVVQLRLDTDALGERHRVQPAPVRPATGPRATSGDLLAFGRNALAEYDFDKARTCFLQAFDDTGSNAAATALLELLVDHLAAFEEALEFEAQLDTPSDEARALLAVAAAHLGRVETFGRLVERNEHPRVAPALLLLASAALKEHRLEDASTHLKRARERDGTLPELVALETELTNARSSARRPDEDELERVIAAGDLDAIDRQASSVLQRWPDSGAARRALTEVESRRRQQRAQALVSAADHAAGREDYEEAKRLYSEAISIGAGGLTAKVEQVERALKTRRDDEAVKAAIESLATLTESSLAHYQALEVPLRERVRAELKHVALEWLEELRDIAAVLALESVVRREDGPPEWVLSTLRPFEERVQRLQVGRQVLQKAKESLKALSENEAKATLESAERALREGQFDAAAQLASRLQLGDLEERALAIVEEANGRLEAARRVQRFEERLEANRPLEALRVVREAEHGRWDNPAEWKARRFELDRRVREELRQEVYESAVGIPSPECAQMSLLSDDIGFSVDGEHYYWVTNHGNELFIRRTSLKDNLVHALVALQLPEELDFPTVLLEPGMLSVLGNSGALLQLSTSNWEVLGWFPSEHVQQGEVIEDALLTPGGRYLWLSVRPARGAKETIRIVDLQRGRVHRETAKEGFRLHLVPRVDEVLVFLSGYEREGKFFTPNGTNRGNVASEVRDIAASPGSSDFVGITGVEREPSDAGLLLVRYRKGSQALVVSGALDGADPDGALALASSHQAQLVFLQHDEEERFLSAFDFGGDEPKRLWRVETPRRAGLAQDVNGQQVSLVTWGTGTGPAVTRLGREAPPAAGSEPPWRPPKLQKNPMCQPAWGKQGLATEIRKNLPEAARMKVLQSALTNEQDVGTLVQLVAELRRYGPQEEAAIAAKAVRGRFPNHPIVLMDQAEEAVEVKSWEPALELLEQVDVKGFTPEQVVHLHHLKGLAHYHHGELKEAAKEFRAAFSVDGGRCDVGEWPQWLEALADPQAKGTEAAELLGRIRRADAVLEKGDGATALRELDTFEVWSHFDVQLGARLVEAMSKLKSLTPEQRIRRRLIKAAFLAEHEQLKGTYWRMLPLGQMTWSSERLVALAEQRRIAPL